MALGGGSRGPSPFKFTPVGGSTSGGGSGVRPGGFGNYGNTNFSGGPQRASHPASYPSTPGASPSDVAKWIWVGTANANPSTPAPSPAAPPGYPSPYDATFFNQINQADLAANQKIGAYNADIANGQTNLNNTLAQLAYNRALAQTNAQNAENAKGGFAQGALGHQLGVIGHQYQYQMDTASTKYGQQKAAWEQAINGVKQGLPLTWIALGLASAARQANLGLQAPAASSPAAAPAPGPPKAVSTAPEPTSHHGGKKGKK